MITLPSQENIHQNLNSYDFDMGKCIDFFVEELGFEGVVIYKDRPGFSVALHYHDVDNYTYILDGELIILMENQEFRLQKGDFFFSPAKKLHEVVAGKGAKYLVASPNGDLEAHFLK